MRTLLLAIALASCGPRAEPAPAARAAPTPRRAESATAEEPDEPVAAPPTYFDPELDRMTRDELEAACYQGSTAACDRLGH
jgi:hypothetical protein